MGFQNCSRKTSAPIRYVASADISDVMPAVCAAVWPGTVASVGAYREDIWRERRLLPSMVTVSLLGVQHALLLNGVAAVVAQAVLARMWLRAPVPGPA